MARPALITLLAAALAMTIPVAIIFFVFQKYIMRTGEGAIKE